MNKSDLIAAVATATGISKSDAAGAVDSTFDVISDALRRGDDVRLTGFGTFDVADRAASACECASVSLQTNSPRIICH